ncbi:MAG TPA: transposase, partial [Methanospirillum sp.]|uniref:transposase n=1 Tax=Methanospirillum sp. TaxID=45200 RepID=UPI002B61D6C0
CSVHIGDEKVNKEKISIFRDFRVICIWNFKAHKWHMYITNLPSEDFSVEDIYELYRFRWAIELVFKELKSDYDLGHLLLGNVPLAYIHIYSMLLRFIISRDLYTWIVSLANKAEAKKYTPTMWSRVFSEKALEFLSILNQQFFWNGNIKGRWEKLEGSLRQLPRTRNDPSVLSLRYSEIR